MSREKYVVNTAPTFGHNCLFKAWAMSVNIHLCIHDSTRKLKQTIYVFMFVLKQVFCANILVLVFKDAKE